ncbi:hypothetical protein BDF22DRAFT_663300 [Syncephalis plumigaleata]|nr:hypothetical protein BDF22DRAFT_663300 [Syncephalis plumigaleata]
MIPSSSSQHQQHQQQQQQQQHHSINSRESDYTIPESQSLLSRSHSMPYLNSRASATFIHPDSQHQRHLSQTHLSPLEPSTHQGSMSPTETAILSQNGTPSSMISSISTTVDNTSNSLTTGLAPLPSSTGYNTFPPRGWTGARRGSAPALGQYQRMRLSSLLETCDEQQNGEAINEDEASSSSSSSSGIVGLSESSVSLNEHAINGHRRVREEGTPPLTPSESASRLPSIKYLLNGESQATDSSWLPSSPESDFSGHPSSLPYVYPSMTNVMDRSPVMQTQCSPSYMADSYAPRHCIATSPLRLVRSLTRPASSPALSLVAGSTPTNAMRRNSTVSTISGTPMYRSAGTGGISPSSAHVCPICQRRFNRAEHVRRHQRVHTQERPYSCSWAGCTRHFARRDNLAQHERTHERRAERRRQKALSRGEKVFTNHAPMRRMPLASDSLAYAELPHSFDTFTISEYPHDGSSTGGHVVLANHANNEVNSPHDYTSRPAVSPSSMSMSLGNSSTTAAGFASTRVLV